MDHMDVNPMGLDGFEFCEFTSADPDRMAQQLEQFGFVAASTHPARAVTRYKQGRINLLLNREPDSHAAAFHASHGPSASAMVTTRAKPSDSKSGQKSIPWPTRFIIKRYARCKCWRAHWAKPTMRAK
jgi:4-hydroxyphenylpyruvate dioxygenase-like putative hemolysin